MIRMCNIGEKAVRSLWSKTRAKLSTLRVSVSLVLFSCLAFVVSFTWVSVKAPPSDLPPSGELVNRLEVYDRSEQPLSRTYTNRWNYHHVAPLYSIPQLLVDAFILSEDKRFFSHSGVDWTARISAVWTNLKHLSVKRGASTITEQVVRTINPRRRSFWSRWLETFEAYELEENFSKQRILEFYLNQVPYANNRRGVVDAAHYYFGRDLSTLDVPEILALVCLVRAPSSWDLYRNPQALNKVMENLKLRLMKDGLLAEEDNYNIPPLRLKQHSNIVPAEHFVRFVRSRAPLLPGQTKLVTTLDPSLQATSRAFLGQRMLALSGRLVTNGSVLILDHTTNEILSWVSLASCNEPTNDLSGITCGEDFDAVLTPRQPGSALKPFLYALAIDKGWTAATIIEDSPIVRPVGIGMHAYRNYSGVYYGPIRLRQALASSLNTPAIRTVEHLGLNEFLLLLRSLGFVSLHKSADYYGPGLALGDGEVTLYELVNAYATLARKGLYQKPRILRQGDQHQLTSRVFSQESALLISDILSDPTARELEFGRHGVLEFPFGIAAKTGTSNDYRDSWAVGYSSNYVVGVWMGNLSGKSTLGVNGSYGSAHVLRGVFSELSKRSTPAPLLVSHKLKRYSICSDTGISAHQGCPQIDELFAPGTLPNPQVPTTTVESPTIMKPADNLLLALDPRVPDEHEKYEFKIDYAQALKKVSWIIDGAIFAETRSPNLLWPLRKGKHSLQVLIRDQNDADYLIPQTRNFTVR